MCVCVCAYAWCTGVGTSFCSVILKAFDVGIKKNCFTSAGDIGEMPHTHTHTEEEVSYLVIQHPESQLDCNVSACLQNKFVHPRRIKAYDCHQSTAAAVLE